MDEFWILILLSVFATNSLDKAGSVQLEELEELPLQTFDEIFVDDWWDKDEAEDLKMPAPTNFGQNLHHQIDRQNTQIGQIEPNSIDQLGQIEPNLTDQLGQIEPNSTDQLGQIEPNSTDQKPPLTASDHSRQIEPNSTDQNRPLTESDHSGQIEPNSTDQNPLLKEADHSKQIDEIFGEGWWDNAKDEEWNKLTLEQHFHYQIDRQNTQIGQIEPNSTDQNRPLTESDHSGQIEPNPTDQNPPLTESDHSSNEKRKIIDKFNEMKNEFKQKGKYSTKEWNQIEEKIAKHLNINRSKIYEWKKEFGISGTNPKNERKNLLEKFNQKKAELKRAGLKNSYPNQINETVAKELGLCFKTIYKWKKELGQTAPQHKHSHSEQKELMKRYYEIKDQSPKKISDGDIAKMLKIGTTSLAKWKKEFKRQQIHPNSVDGHSVEENAAANVQEIGHSNSGTI